MSDASPTEWYADGLRFSCTQCGNCCTGPTGYVWFTPAEAQAMADYLKIPLSEFNQRYTRRVLARRSLAETRQPNGEYDCVFLTAPDEQGKRGCSIYPVRPQQCRTWPFWPENLRSAHDWRYAAQRCPGMAAGQTGQGDFYPVEYIRIVRDSHDE